MKDKSYIEAVKNADEPLTTLQLAGNLNTTTWQINRTVNTLELAGDIEVQRRTNGVNKVVPTDSGNDDGPEIVTDGGHPMNVEHHPPQTCDECGGIHRPAEKCKPWVQQ